MRVPTVEGLGQDAYMTSDDWPFGEAWPRLIHDRQWIDPAGTRWHIRGGALDGRAARKLLKRSDVRVLHVNGPEPRLVDGADRQALMARLEAFFAVKAGPYSRFQVGDFRDDARHIMAVVEESC